MRRVRRIVLIVNPYSSGVTRKRVAEVTAALAGRAEVVVRQTEAKGHATELAAEAASEADALVVFSGDGTYNEAVNGAAGKLPFGFIPGGGASVFPRALGLPRDPVAAARRAGDALEAGRIASIGLGRVGDRRFCFSAGIGFDAEAVRRIDRRGRDRDGRRAGNAIFAATVFGILFEKRLRMRGPARGRRLRARRLPLRRKRPPVHLRRPDRRHDLGRRRLRGRARLRRSSGGHAGVRPGARDPWLPRVARRRLARDRRARRRRVRGALRPAAPSPGRRRGPRRRHRGELRGGEGCARGSSLALERELGGADKPGSLHRHATCP